MKRNLIILALFSIVCGVSNAQFWDYSTPERLGGTINTIAEENMPVFSSDSSILYFVRTFDDENKGGATDQDIWYSRKDTTGGYSDCERLKDLNNKFNNAVVGINKEGTAMYVLHSYDGKKDIVKGIAVSEGAGTSWSEPEKIEIPGLDIEGDFYGFHVSKNEDAIIISYAGPGTKGEEDLYVSTKTGDVWSVPEHMGSVINSVGFEISPFLSRTGDTLFYSSNGFGGEGDADIFYSIKQGSWTKWSTPKNLGPKINSPKFDAYFSHSGSQAYWSSNKDGELSDLYMVNILSPPPLLVSCSSVDATKYQAADGSIDLVVNGGVPPFSITWSNGAKTEDLSGLAKDDYAVKVTDAAGQFAETFCSIDEPAKELDPITVVDYANLEFIHNFGYNKNKLSTSRGDLRKFVKEIEQQLKDGRPSITINIVSSASQVPTKKFGTNEKLAEVRAENMKYDLVEHFGKKDKYKGKVNVVIVSAKVEGPAYEDDARDKDKYFPFQFVSLKTE